MLAPVRPPKAPIVMTHVVDDPEAIRAMARANGPYWQPGRMLATSGSARQVAENRKDGSEKVFTDAMIGPTFRGQWAFGEPSIAGAEPLLNHPGFAQAAREMYQTDVVVPEQVYVNLSTPCGRQGFSHTDIPEFRGLNRLTAPAWLLTAMGVSRLFEAERMHIVTAVAWFYQGEAGGFRYWPEGPDGPSLLHDDVWNTAIVGDNDFMPHEVTRIGPRGSSGPAGMTLDSELECDGTDWQITDHGTVLGRFSDREVRLSVSWKAKVYRDEHEKALADAGENGVDVTEALERFAADLAQRPEPEELAGDGVTSDELRQQLSRCYSAYRTNPGPA
jgi:hypothetical protein